MNKNILAIIVAIALIVGALFLTGIVEIDSEIDPEEGGQEVEIDGDMTDLINCLAEEGLVIYGLDTCPACTQLANSLGGYDAIEPIYVECSEDQQECAENTKTQYVPEIQIDGELYEGNNDPRSLANEVGCEL